MLHVEKLPNVPNEIYEIQRNYELTGCQSDLLKVRIARLTEFKDGTHKFKAYVSIPSAKSGEGITLCDVRGTWEDAEAKVNEILGLAQENAVGNNRSSELDKDMEYILRFIRTFETRKKALPGERFYDQLRSLVTSTCLKNNVDSGTHQYKDSVERPIMDAMKNTFDISNGYLPKYVPTHYIPESYWANNAEDAFRLWLGSYLA